MAAGNQCKAYGAGGIMRMPTRLRIGWQDDNTLKVETDAGQQTRLLHFDRAVGRRVRARCRGIPSAEWVDVFGGGRAGVARWRRAAAVAAAPAYGTGALRVVTTNLRDGYLRKNGVPYSQNAVVTEYFDRVPGPDDAQWLVVKTTVEDPDLPGAAVPVERALHARARRVEVAAVAVRGRSAARPHEVRRPIAMLVP